MIIIRCYKTPIIYYTIFAANLVDSFCEQRTIYAYTSIEAYANMEIEIYAVQLANRIAAQERATLPFAKLTAGTAFLVPKGAGYKAASVRSSCKYWSRKLAARIVCRVDSTGQIQVVCHEGPAPQPENVGTEAGEIDPALDTAPPAFEPVEAALGAVEPGEAPALVDINGNKWNF